MRDIDIETWVHQVTDAVAAGQHVENSRVELKSEWTEPQKCARQLAGHANAARGEPILWIIGLDEERGIVGADRAEFSTWWAQVAKEFDGLAPDVRDLAVPREGKVLVALYLETTRAPFVVKADRDRLEVPWRRATRVDSARREDLLRILVPQSRLPNMNVLRAGLDLLRIPHQGDELWDFNAWIYLYVEPAGTELLVLPNHLVHATVTVPPLGGLDLRNGEIGPGSHRPKTEHRVWEEPGQTVFAGPAMAKATGSRRIDSPPHRNAGLLHDEAKLNFFVTPALADQAVEIAVDLSRRPPGDSNIAASWDGPV